MGDSTNYRLNALARLCQAEILTIREERRLFQQLAGARKGTGAKLAKPRPSTANSKQSARRRPLSDEAIAIRNQIVERNVRLVVSLAKRYVVPDWTIDELVSEGFFPLIQCVERFDADRGTRFSTYATRALTNFFGRLRRRENRRRLVTTGRSGLDVPVVSNGRGALDNLIGQEDVGRLTERLAELPARERAFITFRYGLSPDRRPRTFRELGSMHGLSKERVRVITSQGIERLAESFQEGRP